MIDAALIGLGRWGRALFEAVQGKSERMRFVCAFDPDAAGQRYAADHDLPTVQSFGAALSHRGVHAIVLATPHSLHRAQVLTAAQAGKHVFCEKPLALTVEDARDMIDACRAAGVVLAVGHNRRFWPSMVRLRQLASGGELGRLLHVEGHNSNENSNRVSGGWRTLDSESPGGGLTGSGLHVLDAFVSLLGPVRRVKAQLLSYRKDIPPLDAMSALYEFENGCSALLATVRATPFFWRVHVFGTGGSAEVLGETELVLRMSGQPPRRIALDPLDSVRAELDAFGAAVEGGPAYPIGEADMLATVSGFQQTVAALAAR
ncbi:MAG: Gfo/Idh/MocA family oxidoreductase [Betaproteobacteria bacterium]|nr:Gfo/Idh/MocA family oxidoreductase [Betaproteobacteria bacterium]